MFTLHLTASLSLPPVPISGVSVSRLLDTSSGLSYLVLLSLLLFFLPCSRGSLSRSAFSSSFLTSLDVPVLPPLMDSQVLREDGQGQADHWSPVCRRPPGGGMCTFPCRSKTGRKMLLSFCWNQRWGQRVVLSASTVEMASSLVSSFYADSGHQCEELPAKCFSLSFSFPGCAQSIRLLSINVCNSGFLL